MHEIETFTKAMYKKEIDEIQRHEKKYYEFYLEPLLSDPISHGWGSIDEAIQTSQVIPKAPRNFNSFFMLMGAVLFAFLLMTGMENNNLNHVFQVGYEKLFEFFRVTYLFKTEPDNLKHNLPTVIILLVSILISNQLVVSSRGKLNIRSDYPVLVALTVLIAAPVWGITHSAEQQNTSALEELINFLNGVTGGMGFQFFGQTLFALAVTSILCLPFGFLIEYLASGKGKTIRGQYEIAVQNYYRANLFINRYIREVHENNSLILQCNRLYRDNLKLTKLLVSETGALDELSTQFEICEPENDEFWSICSDLMKKAKSCCSVIDQSIKTITAFHGSIGKRNNDYPEIDFRPLKITEEYLCSMLNNSISKLEAELKVKKMVKKLELQNIQGKVADNFETIQLSIEELQAFSNELGKRVVRIQTEEDSRQKWIRESVSNEYAKELREANLVAENQLHWVTSL